MASTVSSGQIGFDINSSVAESTRCAKAQAFGFTLIELMIVVAIIAILAAVAIPNFMTARDRAKISAAKQNLGILRKAMEMYMSDSENSTYPVELQGSGKIEQDLVASLGKYTTITGTLKEAYLQQADIPMVTQSSYSIRVQARDRQKSILTATPDTIVCYNSSGACSTK